MNNNDNTDNNDDETNKKIVVEEEKQPEVRESFARPPKKLFAKGVQDQLFWTIYIAVYGYNDFLRVVQSQHVSNIEIQEKQKIVDFVSKTGSKGLSELVNYKITRPFHCEIMSDLITQPRMCSSGLVAACAFYQKNIIMVDPVKNTYLKFVYKDVITDSITENNKPIIIYRTFAGGSKQEYHVLSEEEETSFTGKTQIGMFLLESYHKPLKAASNYKTEDLEKIIEIIGMPQKVSEGDDKKKKAKKPELYSAISLYTSWDSDAKHTK